MKVCDWEGGSAEGKLATQAKYPVACNPFLLKAISSTSANMHWIIPSTSIYSISVHDVVFCLFVFNLI